MRTTATHSTIRRTHVSGGLLLGSSASKIELGLGTTHDQGKIPLWPEGKARKNEEFVPLSTKDLELETTMKDITAMKGTVRPTQLQP